MNPNASNQGTNPFTGKPSDTPKRNGRRKHLEFKMEAHRRTGSLLPWVQSSAAALSAIASSLLTVAAAILGWIQPLWFASILLVLSNITIGLSAFHILRHSPYWKGSGTRSLREEAIRRAIEHKN